ncbi:MAG: hypothetical protein ACK4S4_08665 [Pyrinomonadaceae bacterium]
MFKSKSAVFGAIMLFIILTGLILTLTRVREETSSALSDYISIIVNLAAIASVFGLVGLVLRRSKGRRLRTEIADWKNVRDRGTWSFLKELGLLNTILTVILLVPIFFVLGGSTVLTAILWTLLFIDCFGRRADGDRFIVMGL